MKKKKEDFYFLLFTYSVFNGRSLFFLFLHKEFINIYTAVTGMGLMCPPGW